MTTPYDPSQGPRLRSTGQGNELSYSSLPSTPVRTSYRSAVSPRETNLHRSRPTGLVSTRICQNYYSSSSTTTTTTGFGPGLASLVQFGGIPMRGGSGGGGSSTAVATIHSTRERDRRNLASLNDKFAQYVEKVRFLEAQNRKLNMELEALRDRFGSGSSRIREMYDIEIAEAKKLVDDTLQGAAAAKLKADQAEQDLEREKARRNNVSSITEVERQQIDKLHRQIAENEAQIALFRRRLADLDDEARRYKAESQRLAAEINRLQNEIQNELFLKTSCDVEKLALEDDKANLAQRHEADLAELRSRTVSNDLDPSQFFRNELSQAIQEVRSDYESATENRRTELQSRYQLVVNETLIRSQASSNNPLLSNQQQEQSERYRSDILQVRNSNAHLTAKNKEMQNSMAELQRKIKDLQDAEALAKAKFEQEVDEARQHLRTVEQDYDKVFEFKTWLEKEIETYRRNLDGPNGLREFVDRIVQQAQQQALDRPVGAAYPRTIHASGSTTVQHTYINSSSSNYTPRNLFSSSVGTGVPRYNPGRTYEPPSDRTYARETSRDLGSSRDSTLRDATTDDASAFGSPSRSSFNRNSSIRDTPSRWHSSIDDNQPGESHYSTIPES